MIKIAIVDDVSEARKKIHTILTSFFLSKSQEYRIYEFNNAEHLLRHLNDATYNIILLDIDMPGMNGIETSKLLRKNNITSIIIFVTGVVNYMEEAFGLNVFSFVYKDKMDRLLPEVMTKCLDEISSNVILDFKTNAGLITINQGDIIYVSMEVRKVSIYTLKEKILVNLSTLNEFYKKVQRCENFIYANRSTIINLTYVMNITPEKSIILRGVQYPIPISRDKSMEVKVALINWASKRSLV